jgi:signal transduction histidine kinase
MRQPIHALKMLNGCLKDSLAVHEERVGTTKEVTSATSDSSRMKEVLAHLMSLTNDFLVFSSIQAENTFSLSLRAVLMPDICKQVEMVCGIMATERGVTFQVFCSDELNAMQVFLLLLLQFCRLS